MANERTEILYGPRAEIHTIKTGKIKHTLRYVGNNHYVTTPSSEKHDVQRTHYSLDDALDHLRKQGHQINKTDLHPSNKTPIVKESNIKDFRDFVKTTYAGLMEVEGLNESKFISNDGREFTTEKGRTEYRPEVHHVFHNGEHVGYVHQEEIQPYKEIAGSRLVKPLAKRKVWNFHLDPGHSLDGKSVKYRDSSGFGSKKAALEGLAKHHKSSKTGHDGSVMNSQTNQDNK